MRSDGDMGGLAFASPEAGGSERGQRLLAEWILRAEPLLRVAFYSLAPSLLHFYFRVDCSSII